MLDRLPLMFNTTMNTKNLTKDTTIANIGLWTWWIGGFMETDKSNDEESIQAIKNAIDLWYTHIDTAELYGAGHCEKLIGLAIKDYDRKKLFITSKVFKNNLTQNGVISSVNKSLDSLWTNYIDLYMIHVPNPDIDIKETMTALNKLVDDWTIKHIWVSNFNVNQLKEAQMHSKHKIVANQIEYNLVTREVSWFSTCSSIESELIPYCQKNDITIVAYRPVERWVLLKPHPLLDSLSEKYNKTKAQIAINWLISKPKIVTIPKSIQKEHLIENLWAAWWQMDEEDIKLLDETDFTDLL